MVRGTASCWWSVVGHCREVSDLHCNGSLALLGGDGRSEKVEHGSQTIGDDSKQSVADGRNHPMREKKRRNSHNYPAQFRSSW